MNQPFAHKKSLGQNFLNSDYVPKRMIGAVGEIAGKTVLEIGPGTGALTRELLKAGAIVIAIEADPRAIETLTTTFEEEMEAGQLTILAQDARTLDPTALPLRDHEYVVVANIPYYLSGLLLRKLLDTTCQPSTLVFLLQKELAERIARARKGSLLALSVEAFGTPQYVTTVKRGHFTPPPQVDSAILAISDINRRHFADLPSEHFFTLLHLGFGQKRKQLHGILRQTFEREVLDTAFTELALPLQCRAEDLTFSDWLALAQTLPPTTKTTRH